MPVGGLNPLASEWKPPTEQLAQLQLGSGSLAVGGGKAAPAGRSASCTVSGAIAILNGSVVKAAAQRAEQHEAQPQVGDDDGDLLFDELHFGEDGASFERGASTASSAEPSPQVSVSAVQAWKSCEGCCVILRRLQTGLAEACWQGVSLCCASAGALSRSQLFAVSVLYACQDTAAPPHASPVFCPQLVGPSPLPSPAKASPATAAMLLTLTEDPPSNGKVGTAAAAAAAAALERGTEVVTHVETAASAGGGGWGTVPGHACKAAKAVCWREVLHAGFVNVSVRVEEAAPASRVELAPSSWQQELGMLQRPNCRQQRPGTIRATTSSF